MRIGRRSTMATSVAIAAACVLAACSGTSGTAKFPRPAVSTDAPADLPSTSISAPPDGGISPETVAAVATALGLPEDMVRAGVRNLPLRHPEVPPQELGTMLQTYVAASLKKYVAVISAGRPDNRDEAPWPELCTGVEAALDSSTGANLTSSVQTHRDLIDQKFPESAIKAPTASDSPAVVQQKMQGATMRLVSAALGLGAVQPSPVEADVAATAALLFEQSIVCPVLV